MPDTTKCPHYWLPRGNKDRHTCLYCGAKSEVQTDDARRVRANAARRAKDQALRELGLTKVRVNGETLWE